MFYQIFLSQQVKRIAVITYKHTCTSFVNASNQTFEKQKLNLSRSALFHMKTRFSLKYFVNDSLFLLLTRSRPLQTYFFDFFGNSKAFHTVLT